MRAPQSSVGREVVRLAIPAIASGLVGTLVFLADRMMLARWHRDGLASMQLQGPLLWSVTSVFIAACVGTVALVARSTGAGNLARARAVARASLRIAFVLGTIVAAIGLVVLEPLVVVFGPEQAHLRALSAAYLGVTIAALPLAFVATAAAMILTGSGDTRTPLLAGVVANGANIAINAALIYGIDIGGVHIDALGVRGAAIGTAVAFGLEAVVLLTVLRRASHPLCIAGLVRPPAALREADARARREILALSLPAIAERVVVHAGFLAYAKAITTLGTTAMAANQALVTIESICFMCADGFGVAAATVMGQSLGADDRARARRGGAIATTMAVASLSVVGLAVWATGRFTLPVFVPPGTDDPELVATARAVLPLLALAQPFMTASIVLAQGLRGAGDTRSPLYVAIIGGLLVRVSLAWWLSVGLGLGLVGIWWASTIDWGVRTVLLGRAFVRGRWTRVEL